ncbi:hypothetical protein AMEX_G24679 [Astyanax mexicanus]|uniref:Uncharacterized protein n=1 Tax=Astyanax mexicanus TaxID=7994 RepID=A0A8T2KT88_ASTMX|nr:hypothetical protein AMEX_G24679 [Astyanax mexicanus]
MGQYYMYIFFSSDSQSTSGNPHRGTSNNHMAPVAIYEEIEEYTRLPASDTGDSTIYSTAELPTNSSDLSGTISNPIYSSAQLPTNPPDQDIYSMAELPITLNNVEESG